MKSNVEIAQSVTPRPIQTIARRLGILPKELIPYGADKAKVSLEALERLAGQEDGKLILVTAINATKKGEGKTTQSIGLGQGLARIRQRVAVCLREPSLAPVFGMKGGGCGAGYSQAIPMDDINLHFNGDLHAVGVAHNLLAALIDNHIYHGNKLGIDPEQLVWKRALDVSDRALRRIRVSVGQGEPVEHDAGFIVNAASEVMAIHGLARDYKDLKKRLGDIVFGFTFKGEPLRARDLNAQGAMAALLRDALRPNLVQSIEGVPVFVHGGPFANIAHGCSSLVATRLALKLADYVVTEAGFGSELGGEKFFDIKCRVGRLRPSAAVLVATIRGLREHGGAADIDRPNLEATRAGFANLARHIGIIRRFGMPVLSLINRFADDSAPELEFVKESCRQLDVDCFESRAYDQGGAGVAEAARALVKLTSAPSKLRHPYSLADTLEAKAHAIVTKVYGGAGVEFTPEARKKMAQLQKAGMGRLPVVMAKTHYSLSADATLRGAPEGFTVPIRDVRLQAGAGTVVMICGAIMTMPGLPARPGAEQIDLTAKGRIQGLY